MSEKEIKEQQEIENQKWLKSPLYALKDESEVRIQELFCLLKFKAQKQQFSFSQGFNTFYINTITAKEESTFSGNLEIENKHTTIIGRNAMATVSQSNREDQATVGQISTYKFIANLKVVCIKQCLSEGRHLSPLWSPI